MRMINMGYVAICSMSLRESLDIVYFVLCHISVKFIFIILLLNHIDYEPCILCE